MTRVGRLLGALSLVALAILEVPGVTAVYGQTQAPTAAGKKLLFLTHAGFYKHPSLGPAEKAVIEWGKTGGFAVTTVEGYKQDAKQLDFSFLTPEYLNQFDAVMMMTNGNLPFTTAQKEMLLNFVRSGKGFVGVHCASLTFYDYPAFGEMLGAYFLKGATNSAQRKVVVLKVEDQKHPATRMLGSSWPVWDEFYVFGRPGVAGEDVDTLFKNRIPVAFSRDRHHVVLSVDTERTDLTNTQFKAGGDYPQAWSRQFGQGRVFYSAFGHREDIWSVDPVFQAHITGALRWALKLEN